MPVLVDLDVLAQARWPVVLIDSVRQIQTEAGGRAVTPSLARKLLIKYVQPLAPDLTFDEWLPPFDASWQDVQRIGESLQIRATDYLEVCIGSLLIEFPGWVRKPAAERKRNIYCEVCWRHVAEGHKFCSHHDPKINNSAYKAAQRMLIVKNSRNQKENLLLERVKALRNRELRDGQAVDQQWQEVIVGNRHLVDWLAAYRPYLLSYLRENNQLKTGMTITDLLQALDDVSPKVKTHIIRKARNNLHEEVEKNNDQAYGMIRRAEAWFSLEAEYKKNHIHGGKRTGAGRKKSPC